MYIIQKRPGDQIKLGRKGEYNARRIALDLSAWQTRYGDNGTVQLLYQRPGDATPYPVPLTREDHLALWTVAAADTANSGNSGRAELRYYIGDALVKSAISQVVVEPSLGEPGDIPDEDQQSWLDQAIQAGSASQNSAEAAANSAQTAETAANSAAASADSAEAAAQSAVASAQSIQAFTETATTSASAAEASAQSSAASAQSAQTAAESAAASVSAALDTLVDDTVITRDTLWSSEKMIDYLCESIEASCLSMGVSHEGGTVSFDPVPNSSLNVTVNIDANQMSWDTPLPTASNPLRGWSGVSLTLTADTNAASYDFDFGDTFYGGTLNCSTGLLTITHKVQHFDGTEDWQAYQDGSVYHLILPIDGISPNSSRSNRYEKCSHYEFNTGKKLDKGTTGICTTRDGIEIYDPSYSQEDLTAWRNWLASLNANGDPFHIVVRINEPYTIQLEPAQTIAFAGMNSMNCSIGNFLVSYKQDFRYELQQIKDAITALQS